MKRKKIIRCAVIIILCAASGYYVSRLAQRYFYENAILKKIIMRLQADSRVAEVLVTGVNYNEQDRKTYTTIKFLEYGAGGKPLGPRYFTFTGNIIQFQSLVVRFDDIFIRKADSLKGKSAYIFWKVFILDGKETQEYEITKINEVPGGYKIDGPDSAAEVKFWINFWDHVLDPERAKIQGIKNAQIEAPGTMFIPGNLYTIKIEHDGGLRIDASPLPVILRGEKVLL